jgi:tRNA threonylcarbamoyladenosine modification (KEOPS) complex  Pcc1 subunit
MKKVISLIWLPLLAACGESKLGNSSQVKDSIAGSTVGALLGMGYDSHTESFNSVCAESSSADVRVRYTGAPTATLQLDHTLSHEELKNLLDVQVSGKLAMEGLNVKSAARFASEAASTDLSTALVFANKIGGRYAVLNQPRLTASAKAVGLTNDDEKIRAECGDQFVEQAELGAELFVSMRFDFSDKDVKSNFEAEIDLDFVNIFQVSGAAKVAMEKYKNNVGITISALQIGGDPTALSRIFLDPAGDTSNVLRCSIDNIDSCIKTMESVIGYASSTRPGNFPDQLKNLKFDDTSPTGAAILRYITKSYFNAGMRDLYKKPSPLLSHEILAARSRLLERYEVQSVHRKRVSSILNLRLSPEEKSRFESFEKLLASNIKQMVDAAQICYDTPMLCVEAESRVQLQSYDESKLIRNLEFYDHCLLNRSKGTIGKTVNALQNFIDASDATSCEDLERDLKNELVLDLTAAGISDLRPLRGLSQLRVLKLSQNEIRNLETIATLPQLKELYLRKNSIGNIEHLSQNSRLEILDLAYNRIIDVTPLKKLTSLKDLRLQGNQFSDTAGLEAKSFDVLYLNDYQICAFERDYALNQGWISPAQHRAYTESNFGPLYVVPGNRSSGLDRFMFCQAVVSAF